MLGDPAWAVGMKGRILLTFSCLTVSSVTVFIGDGQGTARGLWPLHPIPPLPSLDCFILHHGFNHIQTASLSVEALAVHVYYVPSQGRDGEAHGSLRLGRFLDPQWDPRRLFSAILSLSGDSILVFLKNAAKKRCCEFALVRAHRTYAGSCHWGTMAPSQWPHEKVTSLLVPDTT